jgi:hypothetical protein
MGADLPNVRRQEPFAASTAPSKPVQDPAPAPCVLRQRSPSPPLTTLTCPRGWGTEMHVHLTCSPSVLARAFPVTMAPESVYKEARAPWLSPAPTPHSVLSELGLLPYRPCSPALLYSLSPSRLSPRRSRSAPTPLSRTRRSRFRRLVVPRLFMISRAYAPTVIVQVGRHLHDLSAEPCARLQLALAAFDLGLHELLHWKHVGHHALPGRDVVCEELRARWCRLLWHLRRYDFRQRGYAQVRHDQLEWQERRLPAVPHGLFGQ